MEIRYLSIITITNCITCTTAQYFSLSVYEYLTSISNNIYYFTH